MRLGMQRDCEFQARDTVHLRGQCGYEYDVITNTM